MSDSVIRRAAETKSQLTLKRLFFFPKIAISTNIWGRDKRYRGVLRIKLVDEKRTILAK